MSPLPIISGQEIVKAPKKLGFELDRQRGSYMMLRQSFEPYRRIVVPNHRNVAKGTLRSIIRETGLTVEDFQALL